MSLLICYISNINVHHLVIQALKGAFRGSSDFNLIVEDILALIRCFDNVVWSFIKHYGIKVVR